MKRKKIWSDPGLWILAGTNAWLVIHYYRHPGIFPMLIWIYWYQSVLLGGFNFMDMLTVPFKKRIQRIRMILAIIRNQVWQDGPLFSFWFIMVYFILSMLFSCRRETSISTMNFSGIVFSHSLWGRSSILFSKRLSKEQFHQTWAKCFSFLTSVYCLCILLYCCLCLCTSAAWGSSW